MCKFIHSIDQFELFVKGKDELYSPNKIYKLVIDTSGKINILKVRISRLGREKETLVNILQLSEADLYVLNQKKSDSATTSTASTERKVDLNAIQIGEQGELMGFGSGNTELFKLKTGSRMIGPTKLFLEDDGNISLGIAWDHDQYTVYWDTIDGDPHYEVCALDENNALVIAGHGKRCLRAIRISNDISWEEIKDNVHQVSARDKNSIWHSFTQNKVLGFNMPHFTVYNTKGATENKTGVIAIQHAILEHNKFYCIDKEGRLNLYELEQNASKLLRTIPGTFESLSVPKTDYNTYLWTVNTAGEIVRFNTTTNPAAPYTIRPTDDWLYREIAALDGSTAWAIKYKKGQKHNKNSHRLVKIMHDKEQLDNETTSNLNNGIIKVSPVSSTVLWAIKSDNRLWRGEGHWELGIKWKIVVPHHPDFSFAAHATEKEHITETTDFFRISKNCWSLDITLSHQNTMVLIGGMVGYKILVLAMPGLPPLVRLPIALALVANIVIIKKRYDAYPDQAGISFYIPWILIPGAIATGLFGMSALLQLSMRINDKVG